MVSTTPSYQVCGRKFPSRLIDFVGQYHCPIARPILFWLNGNSFFAAGWFVSPSDDSDRSSKFLRLVRRSDENDELSNGHSPALYGAGHSRHEQGVQPRKLR